MRVEALETLMDEFADRFGKAILHAAAKRFGTRGTDILGALVTAALEGAPEPRRVAPSRRKPKRRAPPTKAKRATARRDASAKAPKRRRKRARPSNEAPKRRAPPRERAELADRVVALVAKSEGGLRAEALHAQLKHPRKDVDAAVAIAIARGLLRKTGKKRGTVYLAKPGVTGVRRVLVDDDDGVLVESAPPREVPSGSGDFLNGVGEG